jgi:U5 small nuclear ribonucleoprotein component
MDEYDEFGNPISRQPLQDNNTQPIPLNQEDDDEEDDNDELMKDIEENNNYPGSILPEDRSYYPDAKEIFGDDVEVKVFMTDDDGTTAATQTGDNKRPILQNVVKSNKISKSLQKSIPPYSLEFISSLMNIPTLCRSVVFVGHLHHGKTSLLDGLLERSNNGKPFDFTKPRPRAFDSRPDEKSRGISIKAKPASMACSDSLGKNWFLNVMDTPGHVNFMDELACGIRVCDGAVLVVCAVEGVQFGTERAIRQLATTTTGRNGISIILVINKIDRLIHELKIPPMEAYQKIKNIVDQVNLFLGQHGLNLIDPVREPSRLLFASAEHGWCVNTYSMALLTCNNNETDALRLAKRCWGDVFFDSTTRGFVTMKTDRIQQQRTFEKFILEPIYKIYSHVLGSEPDTLRSLFRTSTTTTTTSSKPPQYFITLTDSELKMDAKPLLRLVLNRTFKGCATLVDCIRDICPSPDIASKARLDWPIAHNRLTTDDTMYLNVIECLHSCDANGPLLANVVKSISPYDNDSDDDEQGDEGDDMIGITSNTLDLDARFRIFGRVQSGTLRIGDIINVFGEGFAPDDEPLSCRVKKLLLHQGGGRRSCYVSEIPAGNFFLMAGGNIDSIVYRSATLIHKYPSRIVAEVTSTTTTTSTEFHKTITLPNQVIFAPLTFGEAKSVVKIAVEPLHASELPKMLAGLRSIQKSYPLCRTVGEESGEHAIFGTGELYLDTIMYELREHFAKGTEIKVSDPFTTFTETISESSSMCCYSETTKGKIKFSMIANPLETKLLDDIDSSSIVGNKISDALLHHDSKELEQILRKEYGYDILAARSVWAFGPEDCPPGPNLLMDDTLETDKTLLMGIKNDFIQGFRWACRQGPLCDEPIRGVKFKLLDVTTTTTTAAGDNNNNNITNSIGAQIFSAARKVSVASVLTASPRLAEPWYLVDILMAESNIHPIVKAITMKRRGRVLTEYLIPGTTFSRLTCTLPVLDSFGYETDLQVASRGRISCELVFNRWEMMMGDPLDESIQFRPLEPSPPEWLARELVVKTRRRKGLSENIHLSDYFDPEMLMEMVKRERGMDNNNNNNNNIGSNGNDHRYRMENIE